MWIDPSDPAHMYVGNDGGVAESRDRGKSFRFVSNLPLAQYYHVAVDDDRPYHVYGGLQDNGSWRGPSQVYQSGGIRNHHFEVVGGGDGFETLPDPRDSSRGYSLSQGGFLMRWNLADGRREAGEASAARGHAPALQLECRPRHRSLRPGHGLSGQPVPAPLEGPWRDLGRLRAPT